MGERDGKGGQLPYNIQEDPLEEHNRYQELPDLAANITKMLRKYYDMAPASQYQPDEDTLCIETWSTDYGGQVTSLRGTNPAARWIRSLQDKWTCAGVGHRSRTILRSIWHTTSVGNDGCGNGHYPLHSAFVHTR